MLINKNTVAIMMATYNGEKFVETQIDSILSQTYDDWILFIRDDNSKDNTVCIIEKYVQKYPGKVVLLDGMSTPAGGAKQNFAFMHKYVTEQYDFSYYMFCDQDDYWMPDKIASAIERMQAEENKCEKPILIHTDLLVVDSELNVMDSSYVKYRSIDVKIKNINRLLIQNNVTGCTMFWNRKLNELVGSMDDERIVMHDWWIALVASVFGEIVFISEPQIMYRQHTNNVVGATKVSSVQFIKMRLKNLDHVKKTLSKPVDQAILFDERFGTDLNKFQKKTIREFCSLKDRNKISKIACVMRNSFYKQGVIQIIGELIFI